MYEEYAYSLEIGTTDEVQRTVKAITEKAIETNSEVQKLKDDI